MSEKEFNFATTSYMMMLQCWESVPDKRSSFKTLYTNTSKLIEGIAGYLEIGFNPFAAQTVMGEGEKEPSTDKEDKEKTAVTLRVVPPSMNSMVQFPE